MKISSLFGNRIALALAATIVCLSLASCTDFKKVWAEEVAKPKQKRTDLTGPWEGTWKSDVNGHNGKLRCVITKQPDGQYEFHYWAQWQKVLSGSFKQNYTVVENKNKGSFSFSGERDLGKMGGKFNHEGNTTATKFKATYESESGDKGSFELVRPAAKPAELVTPKEEKVEE
ncbi:MAG: hypothetical protein ACI9UA_005494 [Pseudoalteromonas tetraodonis]|jgi:hypothetical protein